MAAILNFVVEVMRLPWNLGAVVTCFPLLRTVLSWQLLWQELTIVTLTHFRYCAQAPPKAGKKSIKDMVWGSLQSLNSSIKISIRWSLNQPALRVRNMIRHRKFEKQPNWKLFSWFCWFWGVYPVLIETKAGKKFWIYVGMYGRPGESRKMVAARSGNNWQQDENKRNN